jgi:hypothetical protein
VKYFAWMLAVLGLVVLLLAATLAAQRGRAGSDCSGRVTIVKGADGEPIECVCAAGALATCFKPGP